MPNNSNFSIGKIQTLVDKFFKLFSNFIDGYDVKDSNVAKTSGGVRSTVVLTGKDGSNFKIDLMATNVSSVFKKTLNVIDGLSYKSLSESASAKEIEALIGPDCISNHDISLDSAIKNNVGALGIDLNKVATKNKFNTDEFKWWRTKAFNQMKYTLICESGNNDAGKVTNINLLDCVKYIDKYVNLISGSNNSEESDELSQVNRTDKQEAQRNVNTTALILVTPILNTIQAELRKLYQEKLNTETSLDDYIPGNESNPNVPEDTSEFDETALQETEEAAEQAAQSQQTGDGTTATQHIGITLKKIQASDELAVLRLASDYNPSDTLSDIDEIINQDEFLNTLTEEPQAFAIEVDDEGFDIEKCDECPECSPCESLCEVFKAGIRAYRNLYILHWMSHGNDMMKLHNLSEEMYEELQGEIDTIGELLVEKQGTVPQLDFDCDYIPVQQYDFQTGLDQIKSLIQMYIDCIDYAYCNQDSDVQSTLDEWLRYWNKQLNYFVKGQEI